jgi:hypothetical protein
MASTPVTKYPSVFSQAYKDTEKCLGFLWYYLLGVPIVAGAGIVGFVLTPNGADQFTQIVLSAFAGVVGAWGFVLITYVFVLVFVTPYRQRNELRRQLVISNNDLNTASLELIKIHQELRKRNDNKAVNIPETLKDITNWYKKTTIEKKKAKPDEAIYSKVLLELFDVSNINEVINTKHFNLNNLAGNGVKMIDKVVRKRMGIGKRGNKNIEMEWARRIYVAIDNNAVGLMRDENPEYIALKNKLEDETSNISETKLYQLIWDYVDNCYSAYSLEVFVYLGDLKSALKYFPFHVREVLREMDNSLSRAAGTGLTQVNYILEKYRAGESVK